VSAKKRSQQIYLVVRSPRINHLPPGNYQVYVDDTRIEGGGVKLAVRLINEVPYVEVADAALGVKREVKRDGQQER
jgi:hypothetical protein